MLQHTKDVVTLSVGETATRCNTLQHTAAHCNTLQRTAAHCNSLQRTAAHCNTLQHTAVHSNTLQHTAAHCSTLQHTAAHCNTAHCSTLQHTATHCSTFQHTTTHCNTPKHTEDVGTSCMDVTASNCKNIVRHRNTLCSAATCCNMHAGCRHICERDYNTLQHAVSHCNPLCNATTIYNTRRIWAHHISIHPATNCNSHRMFGRHQWGWPQLTATRCSSLQLTAT